MLRLISGRNGGPPLRALLLEECAVAAEQLTREFERAGMKVLSERVDSECAFTQALRDFAPDIVLAAPSLPEFGAKAALKLLQDLRPTAPLILVAETFDEHTVVACLRAGAENVVSRGNLSRLGPATQRALAVRQPLKRLSRRQLEVLRLVTGGLTTKDIARRLGLSVKTVETHRGTGMRRLGLGDVATLVRYAVRVGLIPHGQLRDTQVNEPMVSRFTASASWAAMQLAVD